MQCYIFYALFDITEAYCRNLYNSHARKSGLVVLLYFIYAVIEYTRMPVRYYGHTNKQKNYQHTSE
jgi:hypothetical protein